MKKISSVIIDDEVSNRGLILHLVNELNSDFEITGEADSVQSGYTLITTLKPQLVFLDIKMNDGTGFELLEKFVNIDFDIVFISAFDKYALKAFDFNALDYVLKPIDPEKFSKTLNKVKSSIESKDYDLANLKKTLATYDSKKLILTKIPIHVGNQVIFVNIADILYLMSEEGYSVFKMCTGDKYISSKQISDFDFILSQFPTIVRINKGSYVNLNFIESYTKGALCIVSMIDGTEFEIARRKKTEVLAILESKKKYK